MHGANTMISDKNGENALHAAANHYDSYDDAVEQVKFVELLLSSNTTNLPINIDLQNKQGQTALHLAVGRGNGLTFIE